MGAEDSKPTRRAVVASSALLFGGCTSRSNVGGTSGDDGSNGNGTGSNGNGDGSVEERTADVEPNVEPPYRGRFVADGRPVENFEDLGRWSAANDGAVDADGDVRFAGTQSLAFEGTGRSAAVGDYRADPIDLSDEHLSIAANFKEPVGLDRIYLIAEAPDNENRIAWKLQYSTGLEWQRHDLAVLDTEGEPDFADVRRLNVVVNAPEDADVAFRLDDLRAHPRPDTGKVLFRFDGCHREHYERYFPVLEDRDYPGMATVTRDLVSVDDEDRMSVRQLLDLQDAGWEFPNHTTTGQDVRELSPDEFRADVEAMNGWFEEYGIERGTDLFVYPYGLYDGESLEVVDEQFDLAFATGGQTTYPPTNPLTVRSVAADVDLERTETAIDRAAAHRSVAVLRFEDELSGEEFEAVVDRVADVEDRIEVVSGTDLADAAARDPD